jgi:Protein of unknown function (DUF1674)
MRPATRAVNPPRTGGPAACYEGAGVFRGYRPPFSGTLSPVLPNDDNHNDISELPTSPPAQPPPPREVGGREGPEPTRFGDWELRGRCIDF